MKLCTPPGLPSGPQGQCCAQVAAQATAAARPHASGIAAPAQARSLRGRESRHCLLWDATTKRGAAPQGLPMPGNPPQCLRGYAPHPRNDKHALKPVDKQGVELETFQRQARPCAAPESVGWQRQALELVTAAPPSWPVRVPGGNGHRAPKQRFPHEMNAAQRVETQQLLACDSPCGVSTVSKSNGSTKSRLHAQCDGWCTMDNDVFSRAHVTDAACVGLTACACGERLACQILYLPRTRSSPSAMRQLKPGMNNN